MVGNGVTDWKYDTTPAFVEMAYWFGLTDDKLYSDIKNKCDLTYFEFQEKLSDECEALMDRFGALTN